MPGAVKVKLKLSPVSSGFERKAWLSATMLWASSSALTQVTDAPTGTVIAAGPKSKLAILTVAPFATVAASAATPPGLGDKGAAAESAAKTAMARTDRGSMSLRVDMRDVPFEIQARVWSTMASG